MYKNRLNWAFLLVLLTVAACGGGGGETDEVPSNDGEGGGGGQTPPIDEPPADDPDVVPGETFVVSGVLTVNDAMQVDSDVNDPVTAAVGNNTLTTAQPIPNPAIVKGFVTATPTGIAPDRFENTADDLDVFSVSAFASQSILLEIADFDSSDPASVDLDLGLFDEAGNLLEGSLSVANSFESLLVPTDGEYFLVVNAFSGASNYTLSLVTEFATASFGSQVTVDNLRVDELTLAHQPDDPDNLAFVEKGFRGAGAYSKSASQSASITLDLNEETVTRFSATLRSGTAATGGNKRRTLMSMAASGVSRVAKAAQDRLSVLEMIKAMNSREGEDVFLPSDYPVAYQALDSDPVPSRSLQWNLYDIGWNEAQDQLQSIQFQKRPIIAVIDSGIFPGHPDLAGVLVDQRDFVPSQIDGDGFNADASEVVSINDDPACHGFHGTHVSTTAVAPQNSVGITGVAPTAGLIGIKIGHSTGQNCALLPGDIPNAILYAAGLPNASGSVPDVTADVINLSLGSRQQSPEISNAIQQAVAEGVIVVAAAGNDGGPVRSFPAADDNVIAVAATNTLNERSFFSSFYPEVDIAAPGGDVTVDENEDGFADGIVAGIAAINGSAFQAGWALYQGTSMASPTVAAGIALMKGIEPSLTQGDIEAMLSAGDLTVDIGSSGFDNETGFGLMSLPRMIESAVQFSGGGDVDIATVITSTPSSLDFGASLDEITLDLVKLGDSDISVDSVAGSDSLMLADGTFPIGLVSPDSADGFGEYSFVLSRGALESGALAGSITFVMSDATTYEVPVSAFNQVAQGVAGSAAVFFIIERLSADNVFVPVEQQFFTAEGVRGGAATSPDLEAGTYRIVYGTDTDNDLFICDEGELCGTLPFSNFGFDAAFVLNDDILDATYVLQDVANIALTGFDGTSLPAIQPRRVVK